MQQYDDHQQSKGTSLLDSNEVHAKKDKAAALVQQSQPRAALLLYRDLAALCPDEAVFVSNISVCLYTLGDYIASSEAARSSPTRNRWALQIVQE